MEVKETKSTVYQVETKMDTQMSVQAVTPTTDGIPNAKEILFLLSDDTRSKGTKELMTSISTDEAKELIKVLQELTK